MVQFCYSYLREPLENRMELGVVIGYLVKVFRIEEPDDVAYLSNTREELGLLCIVVKDLMALTMR
jgi:hypothetical protein